MSNEEIDDLALTLIDADCDIEDPGWHEGIEWLLLLDPNDVNRVMSRLSAMKAKPAE